MLFGFAAGLMYLEQANRLKRKRMRDLRLRLPTLEWLQTVNARAMLASMLLVGVAVASGIVLNLLNARQKSPSLPWTDPVVLGTLTMFGWLLLHIAIGAFYRPIRRGRKVAFLTLASFLFLVIALVGMFVTTRHGGSAGERKQVRVENFKSQILNLKSQLENGASVDARR